MSIVLKNITPKPLVTDEEGRTLTGAQYRFTEPPVMEKAMVLKPRATPPTDALSQQEGSIYYDSDDKIYYFYDGTTWTSLVAAVGGTPIFSPSVDNRLVRFDGVGGSIQGSTATLGDTGNLSGLGTVTATGLGTFVGVNTDSIEAPSGTVSFSGDHVNNVNILDATTARVTTLQTTNITSSGTSIDCNNKTLSNVNTVNAGTFNGTSGIINGFTQVQTIDGPAAVYVTAGGSLNLSGTTGVNVTGAMTADTLALNSISTPVITTSGTDISFSNKNINSVKKATFSTTNATTDTVLSSQLGVEALARFALTGDGTMKFTNGSASIFGTQAFLSKVSTTGALQIGFTAGARDGNLCLGGLLGGGSGTALNIDNSSGDITMTSNTLASTTTGTTTLTCTTLALAPSVSTTFNSKPVTGITNLTATGTITGNIVLGTAGLFQYMGTSTNPLRASAVVFKQTSVFSYNSAGGVQTAWTFTIPAGTLTTYGDGIRIYTAGRSTNSANAKFLRFSVNATNYDSAALGTSVQRPLIFEAYLTYVTATSYNLSYKYFEDQIVNEVSIAENIACNNWSSASNTLTFSCSGGALTNDLIIRHTVAEIV